MARDSDGTTVTRVFLIIFTVLVTLLALASIGLIIYGYVSLRPIWNQLGTFGVVALVLLLVAVALIVLVALCGLCGACCRSRCCLIFFTIFVAIWVAVLIALGIVAIIIPPNYFSQTDDSKCTKVPAFNELQTFSQQAKNSICFTCGCYFPNIDNSAVYSASEITQLQTTDAPLYSKTDTSKPVRAQDCSGWNSSVTFTKGANLYAQFEDKFKCTGWCSNTSSLFYKFTNINNGKPKYTCYERISYYIKKYARVITIISFVQAGLMLISFILAVMYLCRMGDGVHNALQGQATAQHIQAYTPSPPYSYK